MLFQTNYNLLSFGYCNHTLKIFYGKLQQPDFLSSFFFNFFFQPNGGKWNIILHSIFFPSLSILPKSSQPTKHTLNPTRPHEWTTRTTCDKVWLVKYRMKCILYIFIPSRVGLKKKKFNNLTWDLLIKQFNKPNT